MATPRPRAKRNIVCKPDPTMDTKPDAKPDSKPDAPYEANPILPPGEALKRFLYSGKKETG